MELRGANDDGLNVPAKRDDLFDRRARNVNL
jgi:hypothetical protein